MTLMSAFNWFDIVLLLTILWCAFDTLRQIDARHEPLQAFALCLVCMGSFGAVAWRTTGIPIQWWRLAFDAGFCVIAVGYYVRRDRTKAQRNLKIRLKNARAARTHHPSHVRNQK